MPCYAMPARPDQTRPLQPESESESARVDCYHLRDRFCYPTLQQQTVFPSYQPLPTLHGRTVCVSVASSSHATKQSTSVLDGELTTIPSLSLLAFLLTLLQQPSVYSSCPPSTSPVDASLCFRSSRFAPSSGVDSRTAALELDRLLSKGTLVIFITIPFLTMLSRQE